MKLREILNTTEHRPWPMPATAWKFYQEWENVVFLHWQVAIEDLKEFVPDSLTIDLYEGRAWVSLLIFDLKNMRPKFLPAFPPISNFYEINLRTYVSAENKGGIYFLKLEASNLISAKLAKILTKLPYVHSHLKREPNSIIATNKKLSSNLQLDYEIGSLKEKKDIDSWLMERYVLFQVDNAGIHKIEIHHFEWNTYKLYIKNLVCNYPKFQKLINPPALTHYSTGVQVVGWMKKEIG